MRTYEVAIIGAGVAGTSLAYVLARRGLADVVVLEAELGPAAHASGRSARTLLELDPNPTVQALKVAGARFLRDPPADFSDRALLDRKGAMLLLDGREWRQLAARLPAFERLGVRVIALTPVEVRQRVDVIDRGEIGGAAFLPDDGYIDVDALIGGFLGHARRAGVEVRFDAAVRRISRPRDGLFELETAAGGLRVRRIVDAAGAWADVVAEMAGAGALGLRPLRRSLGRACAPDGTDASDWPLVWSDLHRVYFRSEGSHLLVCPMDEEPSRPCDARARADVFAEARARLGVLAPALGQVAFEETWAGLRTFAADGVPVVGADQRVPGLFWLAGQGGSGIETAAALAEIAADLLIVGATERFDARLLDPARKRLERA